MGEQKDPKIPEPFKPHPNLGDEINRAIVENELKGGVFLDSVPVCKKIEMTTQNRVYMIEKRLDGYYISGHPEFCPTPTKINIHGSTFVQKSNMIKIKFIGRGMFLEFSKPQPDDPEKNQTTWTSEIKEVRELSDEEGRMWEEYEREVGEGVHEIKKEEQK